MRIGVFDSGIGGLTVLKSLLFALPGHEFIYLGDTARVPYGIRSPEIIRQYALEDSLFLLEKNVDLIVVACNTASAHAAEFLKKTLKVPVIDVIGPGAQTAVKATKSGCVGIIGTPGTIQSKVYEKELARLNPKIKCHSQATPLFVPLVEEGIEDSKILSPVLAHYLTGLLNHKIDTLILGCTHYPLLKAPLARFFGSSIALVDSADAVARTVADFAGAAFHDARRSRADLHQIFVTDAPERVRKIAERVLGASLEIRLVRV